VISQGSDWRLRARCKGQPLEFFFAPDDEKGSRRLGREQRAKQICQSCPVLELCRTHALNAPEHYGVWGGMTPLERRRLRGGVGW
jgi:WhiB family transcriptional regulator, redox-sensing transcriptional regulator